VEIEIIRGTDPKSEMISKPQAEVIRMKYGVGDRLDDFERVNSQGQIRRLSDELENNNVMLVTFRGYW